MAEIEKLGRTSPIAAMKTARQLEVAAVRVGCWAAHDTHKDTPPDQAAAALGLNAADTRKLLARYGCWSLFR